MDQTCRNLDCRNFAPVDVAKGICHATKQMVPADGKACKMFEKLPKCKYCKNYTPGEEEYLGTCAASPFRPMTYPDLAGVTCDAFSWKKPG
jgi:4-hydroxyphenylacetate decarboxylase small subunit